MIDTLFSIEEAKERVVALAKSSKHTNFNESEEFLIIIKHLFSLGHTWNTCGFLIDLWNEEQRRAKVNG